MAAELFHSYEEQFIKGIGIITKKIQSFAVQSHQKKQMAFLDIKADLAQTERNIKLMNTEINNFPISLKDKYQQKIRQYKKDFDDAKKKLLKEQEQYSIEKSKQALMNAQLDEGQGSGFKERLIDDGQQMTDTTYKLKQSVRMMYENEEISAGVSLQLNKQTGQIKGNKEKLGLIRGQLGIGQRRIKNMMSRIRKNKFILAAVFAIILLIGVIILAVKLSK